MLVENEKLLWIVLWLRRILIQTSSWNDPSQEIAGTLVVAQAKREGEAQAGRGNLSREGLRRHNSAVWPANAGSMAVGNSQNLELRIKPDPDIRGKHIAQRLPQTKLAVRAD